MHKFGFWRRTWLAGMLGLAMFCSMESRATVFEIEDLVVFSTPVLSGDALEVSLILTQPIESAIGGGIALALGIPAPSSVVIAAPYAGIISVAVAGFPQFLSIDQALNPGTLAPGTLFTWRFSPALAEGTVIRLFANGDSPPFANSVDAFDLNDFSEDTYLLSASVTVSSIPEPGPLVLMAVGLALLAVMRIKRLAS